MRKRDYKAEYARRTERAKAKGFSGYSQQRKVNKRAKVWTEKLAERLATDLAPYFENMEEPDDLFDYQDSLFWEAFRNYYAKGTSA